MDTLPQELINRIVHHAERYEGQSHLPALQQQSLIPSKSTDLLVSVPSKFPAYATLSRSWKEAVEMVTFHRVYIESTELDRFKAIVTSNRRKYLTDLSFRVLLPEPSQEACRRVESEEEQQLNNEAFSQGIRELFSILRAWEDEGVQSALQLELPTGPVYAPTDARVRNRGQNGDIGQRRWERSLLKIVQPDMLPTLLNVQYLNIQGNGLRKLAPRVGPDLAKALPNLENIFWEFGDCDDQFARVRSDSRVTFAEALKRVQIRKHSTANIQFYHEYPSDQRVTCQSIVPSGLTYDPLSASLRSFSCTLTALTLSAHLDSTLFWPSKDESDAAAPSWLHLRTLEVTFDMVSPSGAWYFTGPRPADHEDDDPIEGIIGGDQDPYSGQSNYTNYREHADHTLHPFLCAFAKAVQHMPLLEHYALTSELDVDKGKFHMFYYAPGHAAQAGDEGEDDLRVRRLYFEVGEVWRPDHEIMEGLRCAGKEKFGGEVIEKFLPSQWL